MARRKEFNRQEALLIAMHVFWVRGFEVTTMTDLRKAMGIGRQSLYDTFGDKKSLFQEALAHYVSVNDRDVLALKADENGLRGIRNFFERRVDMLSKAGAKGCLMINSCVEVSAHDQEIAAQLRMGLAHMQAGLKSALERAASQNLILQAHATAQMALYLTSQIAGMVVMAKNQASRAELQSIVDMTLNTLES